LLFGHEEIHLPRLNQVDTQLVQSEEVLEEHVVHEESQAN